jgi:hypothetical protein
MITREDYLNALELVDQYHQQLKVPNVSVSVCYCGKPSREECEPCCSLSCALKSKLYR